MGQEALKNVHLLLRAHLALPEQDRLQTGLGRRGQEVGRPGQILILALAEHVAEVERLQLPVLFADSLTEKLRCCLRINLKVDQAQLLQRSPETSLRQGCDEALEAVV